MHWLVGLCIDYWIYALTIWFIHCLLVYALTSIDRGGCIRSSSGYDWSLTIWFMHCLCDLFMDYLVYAFTCIDRGGCNHSSTGMIVHMYIRISYEYMFLACVCMCVSTSICTDLNVHMSEWLPEGALAMQRERRGDQTTHGGDRHALAHALQLPRCQQPPKAAFCWKIDMHTCTHINEPCHAISTGYVTYVPCVTSRVWLGPVSHACWVDVQRWKQRNSGTQWDSPTGFRPGYRVAVYGYHLFEFFFWWLALEHRR